MIGLLVLGVLAPLAGAATAGAMRGRFARASGWIVAGAAALAFVAITAAGPGQHGAARWAAISGIDLTIGVETTPLTWIVALVVAGVATLVLTYATAYMRENARYTSFFVWMGIFVGGMLGLVLASSLLLLVACWELVGVTSFVLIGFEYGDAEARRAARRAFLVTRSADAGLLLAWILATIRLRTTEIGSLEIAARSGLLSPSLATLLAVLFVVAALGKSAQLPFSIWLPDAMVAPTPVSALLHAATMVVAGVFLVLRLYPVFEAAPAVRDLLAFVGGATALAAAFVATAQPNLKRVLAWSTVSQIGEMMLAAGLGASFAASEHLAAHALFKATLFLGAGVLDHAAHTRELEGLRGAARPVRWTAASLVVGALALAGVPPLAGFWGEEEILARAAAASPVLGALVVLLVALGGTYIARAVATTLRPPSPELDGKPAPAMVLPTTALALTALVAGLARSPLEHLLGATPVPAPMSWLTALVAGSLVGLAWGAWSAFVRGPAPALGAWTRAIERAIELLALGPTRVTLVLARVIERTERALDEGARSAARVMLAFARGAERAELTLDAGASDLAQAAYDTAGLVRSAEDRGISDGLDRAARLLARGSSTLRRAESGKIYVYTMSLFVWVAVATAFILITRG
jgi:NADH-quinone oxidoreductase subunit L